MPKGLWRYAGERAAWRCARRARERGTRARGSAGPGPHSHTFFFAIVVSFENQRRPNFNFARFPEIPSAQVRRYMMMCTDLSSLIHILIYDQVDPVQTAYTHTHTRTPQTKCQLPDQSTVGSPSAHRCRPCA